MNCCIALDCAQERLDLVDTQHYSSGDLSKIYCRDLPTDGITPNLSSCNGASENELSHFFNQKHAFDNYGCDESLIGAVATTYDEIDQVEDDYEKPFISRGRNCKLPKLRKTSRKSYMDVDGAGQTLRSIFTKRDGNLKMRTTRMEDFSDSSFSYREFFTTPINVDYRS